MIEPKLSGLNWYWETEVVMKRKALRANHRRRQARSTHRKVNARYRVFFRVVLQNQEGN